MKLRLIACFALLGLIALPAFADDYTVSVGYADGLRGPGFFPNPWNGDPGVVFVGGSPGGAFDAGAIMITNTSGGSITINDISVNIGGVVTGSLWGSNVLLAGQSLVVTQTTDFNFDTSDSGFGNVNLGCGVNNGIIPVVTVTENGGTPQSFNDSGQVLNTSGYDFACLGNESFAWRPIGTFGGPAGQTPEPASLMFLGAGVLGLTRKYWKRSIAA